MTAHNFLDLLLFLIGLKHVILKIMGKIGEEYDSMISNNGTISHNIGKVFLQNIDLPIVRDKNHRRFKHPDLLKNNMFE